MVLTRLKALWIKKWYKRLIIFTVFVVLMGILDFCFPIKPHADYSTVVLDDKGQIVHAYLNKQQKWRIKSTITEVSPFFVNSILEKEDKYFYYHPGVNPVSILRAFFSNIKGQKRVSGASTITMQVVRLMYPSQRTYWSKLREMFRAFQLEVHYSKDEILAIYMDRVPFGANIEGIKAASYFYLAKHPSTLNLAEAMTLSIIPNKPNLLLSRRKEELERFKDKWLEKFKKDKIFEADEIEFAQKQNVSFSRKNSFKKAQHFSARIKDLNMDDNAYLATTLNLKWQQQAESQLAQYLKRLSSLGVKNGTILVVDNRTMGVKVYCGSGNYLDKSDGGQVDGIKAIRSPGSTLKPFLYALSAEKGFLNPKKILYDIPSDFEGFVPENFDQTFKGQVRAADALQSSLNIPAVSILKEYGVKTFIQDLKKAKFRNVQKNEDKLGLSVILGGCGASLEELVKLYACMGNGGVYKNLSFLKNQTPDEGIKLLDSASVYIVSEILSGIQRPDFPNNFDFTYKLPKIAWKTGTSFGKKDAWAIGYNPNYTVGVWLGNFSGEGMPDVSGALVATPL
ncbi:MAG: penicillin-binding protein 1C, partial [Leadbetterella sp.]